MTERMSSANQGRTQNQGFSIRCPHCFNLSEWKGQDPAQYLVESQEEWVSILKKLVKKPEIFSHTKMLCCLHHPDHGCPLSFQAFLCKDDLTAHKRRHAAPGWSQPHAFQLRDLNQTDTLPYSVVMLSVRSVGRQRHIELDSLVDRDLLSRSVLGMSLEINAPITIYTPKFIEHGRKVEEVWLPIEAYDLERNPVPPHYNQFCEICREAFLAPILTECEKKKLSTTNCPLHCGRTRGEEKLCLGRPAPCELESPNLSQCPVFLKERARSCQCYGSDCKLISEMKERWSAGTLDRHGVYPTECWAGLQERAVPIIIHEHLAGIAITGQFVLRDKVAKIDIESLVQNNSNLAPHLRRLRRVVSLMRREAEPRNGLEHYTLRFVVNDLKDVENRFVANIQRLADSADARYHHNRAGSEAVFREQILGRIAQSGNNRKDRLELYFKILELMRKFWAFRSIYWFTWNDNTKDVKLVATAHRSNKPKFLDLPVGTIDQSISEVNCPPWLYRREGKVQTTKGGPKSLEQLLIKNFQWFYRPTKGEPISNEWIESFHDLYEGVSHEHIPELDNEGPSSHFFVFVKHGKAIHALVFAERDESQVSPLRPADKGNISPICQHAIADTCDSVVRAYLAREDLDLLQWQQEALTIGAIGTTLVHDLVHNLTTARDYGDYCSQELTQGDVASAKKYMDVNREAIRNNIELTRLVEVFRERKKPHLSPTRLLPFLDKCIKDALLTNKEIDPGAPIGDDLEILVDPLLLKVAINNIFKNVEKKALNIKQLVVTVHQIEAKTALVTIEDNGVGFPSELLSEFDALFNDGILTSSNKCLGLGFVIVRAVMQLHGGRLHLGNVAKKGGSGGRVELYFPQVN